MPCVNLMTELTLIFNSSFVTAPPRKTVLARAPLTAVENAFSMRHRNAPCDAHPRTPRHPYLVEAASDDFVVELPCFRPFVGSLWAALSDKRLFGCAQVEKFRLPSALETEATNGLSGSRVELPFDGSRRVPVPLELSSCTDRDA